VESELLGDIRAAANKGLALGGERFKNEIEQLCGRRMGAGKMGRPTKQAGAEKV
jgi:putative transposase